MGYVRTTKHHVHVGKESLPPLTGSSGINIVQLIEWQIAELFGGDIATGVQVLKNCGCFFVGIFSMPEVFCMSSNLGADQRGIICSPHMEIYAVDHVVQVHVKLVLRLAWP